MKIDIVSGGVLAGLGLYIVAEARHWEYLGPDGPGPGFFPLWYGLAMIALALVLVATGTAPTSAAPRPGPGRPLVTLAAVGATVGLLQILGFLLAFGLFTLFVGAVMYRRPLLPTLAVAVGCAVGFYLLFPLALHVELPRGLLGF
jgi:putative tricarboxylic transport membrane protein